MRRFDRFCARWAYVWEATQVELRGQYTIANVQEFEQYHATTSCLRALLVCFLTPLPCLIVIVLVDLLPLEPPSLGPAKSPNVWIRTLVLVAQITFCVLQQFRQHLPQLALSYGIMVVISFVAATSSVAFCYGMAFAIGYPVPFHMVLGMPPWGLAVVTMVVLFRGKHRFARLVGRYTLVFVCQMAMTVVYPVFNYVYSSLSSTRQTGVIFVLPVIKILAKNWIGHTLPDSDDAKPEAVVFNVEVFHTLFVSLCMGKTTSSRTVFVLMAIDLLQAWLSFADVQRILSELRPLADKLTRARQRPHSADAVSAGKLHGLVGLCNRVIEVEASQPRPGKPARTRRRPSTRQPSRIVGMPFHPTSVIGPPANKTTVTLVRKSMLSAISRQLRPIVIVTPEPSTSCAPLTLPSDLASLSIVERGVLVRQTQKVLFVTEFFVLVEYTEVIMPMIYTIYVVATWYLPNRAYYPNLQGIDSSDDLRPTIANVQLYVALEFASLICVTGIMWWKLRLSLLHQLAFVLEKRFANIQAKLLLWVLYAMQTSIVQLGTDYSFRFAWLDASNSLTASP